MPKIGYKERQAAIAALFEATGLTMPELVEDLANYEESRYTRTGDKEALARMKALLACAQSMPDYCNF